jgi:hypothetical protein
VLVLVVLAPVLELAEHVAGVMVRHVVVIVGVHEALVGVLVLPVAHHALHDWCLLHAAASLVP